MGNVRAPSHYLFLPKLTNFIGILYIALPLPDFDTDADADALPDPQKLLKPYLDATLALSVSESAEPDAPPLAPLFSTFYIQHPAAPSPHSSPSPPLPPARAAHLAPAPLPPLLPLPDAGDAAAVHAAAVFWAAVRMLRPADALEDAEDAGMWPALEEREEEEE